MFVHLHVNHTCADFHISVDLYHISLDPYHDTSPSLIGDAADYFFIRLQHILGQQCISRGDNVDRQLISVTFCHAHAHCLCCSFAITRCILIGYKTYA